MTGELSFERVDARIGRFCARFPQDKRHRWVRDLATELLHNADPERIPLMNRWVWDATANTGVIREIWHGDDVDRMTMMPDDVVAVAEFFDCPSIAYTYSEPTVWFEYMADTAKATANRNMS